MSTNWSENIVVTELADEPMLSDELGGLLDRLETSASTPHIVLNLGRVSYVNSSNIAQLLKLRKRLTEQGRQLRLCSVGQEVWSVMSITGLDKVFRFAPDPMTALASLQIEDAKNPGDGGPADGNPADGRPGA